MKIEIPITEFDIELFKDMLVDNETINWEFKSDTGEMVHVELMSEDELKQRNQ